MAIGGSTAIYHAARGSSGEGSGKHRRAVASGAVLLALLVGSMPAVATGRQGPGPRDVAAGQWTWQGGSSQIAEVSAPGIYGTKGVPNSANRPGARRFASSWTDASGNLWLFGGTGYAANAVAGSLNDLWKWDGSSWTWVSGSSSVAQAGVYGTKGVPGAANVPGSRSGAMTWVDGSGNAWLFGGQGYGSTTSSGYLNDLWKWDGSNWTWVSGTGTINQTGTYGTLGVADPANLPGGRQYSVAWTDSSGKLWIFGGLGYPATGATGDLNDLWRWDGSNWAWMNGSNLANQLGVYGVKGTPNSLNVPGARYWAVSWTDASGNFWMFGGNGYPVSGGSGFLNDLWKWDGTNWTWVNGANVAWQQGTYGVRGVPNSANVPGARYAGNTFRDGSGNLWLFGGYGNAATLGGYLDDLWKWDGTNWTWMSGPTTAGQAGVYGTKGVPNSANLPGGRSNAAAWKDSAGNFWIHGGWGLNTVGTGYLADLWKWDGTNWTWVSGVDNPYQYGIYGTKGVSSPSNVPGGRYQGTGWTDSSGRFWLFGGNGYSSTGSSNLNDLWRWDGAAWTWMSGSSTGSQNGTYGTKGIASASNVPGSRFAPVSWRETSGNAFLFGGYGQDGSGVMGYLSDLWKWDGTNWTWASGSSASGQAGTYGSLGVANAANTPGGRYASVTWRDLSGNLWLFGGYGLGSVPAVNGYLSDLWKWDGTNWTWVNGPNVVNQVGVYGSKGTPNALNVPGGRQYAVGWTDLSGNLWLFGGQGYATSTTGYLNDLWRWDGTAWTWMSGTNLTFQWGAYGTQGVAAASNVPGTRYESIAWADSAGTAWLFGGYGYGASSSGYLSDLWRWDGTNWTWVDGPTTVNDPGTYGTKGTAAAPNGPGGRAWPVGWVDTTRNLWLFGGYGYDTGVLGTLNDLWSFGGACATPSASSNSPVCQGSPITLSTPAVSGATYSWTGPNGFTSAAQNPTIASAVVANAGTYSVTVTVGSCVSPAGVTSVAVNTSVPSTPSASSNGPLCEGGTILLSTPTVPGAHYAWTGPSGFTSSQQNPSIANAVPVNAGTYSVTVTVGGCTSAAGTTGVTVNPRPATPSISTVPALAPSTGGWQASVAAHGGSAYSWGIGNGSITSGQGTSQIAFSSGPSGLVTLTVTETAGGCASAQGAAVVPITSGSGNGVPGTWAKLGPDGGEITAVTVDPTSPSTVWAATYNGVFKSMDGGLHWTQSWLSATLAFAVAVHPTNGSIVFLVDRNRRIYRSTDGGDSWALSSGGLPVGSAGSGRLRFQPGSPSVMLYASSANVFKSTDSGASWALSESGLPASKTVSDVVFAASTPQTVFAWLGNLGIYRSTDSGDTWAPSNVGLPSRVSGPNTYYDIGAFAVDPSNPQHLFAYRSWDDLLYASTNGGASWALRSGGNVTFRSLLVPPGSGQVLYASGLDYWSGSPSYLGRIYKSVDAGVTWTSVSDSFWSGYGGASVLAATGGSPAPVWAAIGGVLRKSTDGGGTWDAVSAGLRASEFVYFAFVPGQTRSWYVHGSSNGIQRTTDAGETWTSANGNLVDPANGTLAVDPANPLNLVTEGGMSEAYLSTGQYYAYLSRSTDGGSSWNMVPNPEYPTYRSVQAWGAIALPTTPTTFVVAAASGNEGVFKSTDAGATFQHASTGLPTRATYPSLQYMDVVSADQTATVLFVAANNGAGIYKSTDGGAAWAPSGNGLGATPFVRQLAVSPAVPQRLFAVVNGSGLYRSTDGGGTWAALAGIAATSGVMTAALDPADPSVVLASGTLPSPWVSRSTDAGDTWTPLPTKGLDLSAVWRIAVDPANPSRVLAAGRGGVAALVIDPTDPLGKGVSTVVEAAVPNPGGVGTGDGNGDGIQDTTQPNVASLPLVTGGGWATVAGAPGTTLSGVQSIVNPSPGDLPAGITFPSGLVQFDISGAGVGGCTTAALYVPKNLAINGYVKYGPTPDNATPHWYDFAFDGTTGAEVFQDATRTRIVLHLCDGLRGDGDIVKNGVIRDPGGPVVSLLPATPTPTSNTPVCVGDTISLSTPAVASATYSWTGPNGFSSVLRTPTIPGATAAAGGTYSVTVTVGLYSSLPGTTGVTVNAWPAVTSTVPATAATGFTGGAISWSADGATSYDLRFDTVNPPQKVLAAGTAVASAPTPVWFANTTYYWQVVAHGPCGNATSSVYSFTTGTCAFTGSAPVLVSPADAATAQSILTLLSWNPLPGTSHYDVYVGTTNPPTVRYAAANTPATSVSFAGAPGTTYYWQVKAVPVCGNSSPIASVVRSFTTGAGSVTLSSVAPTSLDRWTGGSLSVLGSGFLATTTPFTDLNGRSAGTYTSGPWTASQIDGTVAADATAPAGRYDVGLVDAGIEKGRLSRALVLRAFTDVNETLFFFESSSRVVDAGLMEADFDAGTAGPQFVPTTVVTRALMAEYMAKSYQWLRTRSTALPAATCTPSGGGSTDFPDVPCSHPDWLAIHWIKTWGITAGANCVPGPGICYLPDTTITRGQMATFLSRLKYGPEGTGTVLQGFLDGFGANDPGCLSPYPACSGWTDPQLQVPASTWPHSYVNVAYQDRLTNGCSGTVPPFGFCTGSLITRGQMAEFLGRTVGLVPTP